MARLEAEPPPRGLLAIQGFRGTGFRIGGKTHDGAVLVYRDRAAAWDAADRASAERLILRLGDPRPELILFGTGAALLRPDAAFVAQLRSAGIASDAMDSRAAARTFNLLLAEGRRVAAALLPLA